MTTNKNPGGLPRGAGSIQMRGLTWWMIFRDGRQTFQENTGTAELAEARRILARRVLPYLEAKVRAVRAVAYGGKDQDDHSRSHGTGGRKEPHRATAAAPQAGPRGNGRREKEAGRQ